MKEKPLKLGDHGLSPAMTSCSVIAMWLKAHRHLLKQKGGTYMKNKKNPEPKVDWILHAIDEGSCACCHPEKAEEFRKQEHPVTPSIFPMFFNIHSHGLERHGQRNLCTVIDIGASVCARIINAMGLNVAGGYHAPYGPGVHDDILASGMPVELMEFPDDPTLYIIFPDEQGRLPADETIDEDKCDFPYSRQKAYARIIHEDRGYV